MSKKYFCSHRVDWSNIASNNYIWQDQKKQKSIKRNRVTLRDCIVYITIAWRHYPVKVRIVYFLSSSKTSFLSVSHIYSLSKSNLVQSHWTMVNSACKKCKFMSTVVVLPKWQVSVFYCVILTTISWCSKVGKLPLPPPHPSRELAIVPWRRFLRPTTFSCQQIYFKEINFRLLHVSVRK